MTDSSISQGDKTGIEVTNNLQQSKFSLGDEAFDENRFIAARDWFQVAAAEGDLDSKAMLALTSHRLGDEALAHQIARDAAAEGSQQAAALIGHWLFELGRSDPEVEAYLRGGADVWSKARLDLSKLIESQGDSVQARKILEEGASLDEVESLLPLALAQKREGNLIRSEQLLRRAVELGEPAAFNNLGFLLLEQGSFFEAHGLLVRARAAGNPLATRNLKLLRARYRRQLNRAFRRQARLRSAGS